VINTFRILFVNELISILREKVALFWIFFFPFFFLAMLLMSYGQEGVLGHQRIEIVDNDHTALSARYVDTVRKAFSAGGSLHGEVIELERIPEGPVRNDTVRVTLPQGFGQALGKSQDTMVEVAYNFAGNFSTQVAARVFTVLTTRFNAEATNLPLPAKLQFVNTTQLRPVSYAQYLLTGILIMSMMTSGMNNACIGIVERRERNTFKLLSCLPLSPGTYLASILAARIVILVFATFVLLLGGRFAYGIDLPLSLLQAVNAVGLILVGGITLLSMGIAMSARITRVPTAMFLCNVVYLSLLFVSDLTMPLNNYPSAVRPVLMALPTSQFIVALRAILIQGASLLSQWHTVLTLAGWSAACLLLGRATFRWHRV
jgi:ABC-2 type transport system permease protein